MGRWRSFLKRSVWILVGTILLNVSSAPAQLNEDRVGDSSDSGDLTPLIRTETNLVLTRFHVVRDGYYVEALRREDIRLKQDNKKQRIAVFEGPHSDKRTMPVEIILLLDVSRSVTNRTLLDGDLLDRTIMAHLDEHASVSVYGFARRLKRFAEPTRDKTVLSRALGDALAYTHGATNLYDSIEKTCQMASEPDPRALRVMVVFSDGFETGKVEPSVAEEAARKYDIKLYPVVLGHALQNTRKQDYQVKSPRPQGGGSSERHMEPGHRPGAPRQGENRPRPQEVRASTPSGSSKTPVNKRAYQREMRMLKFAELGKKTGGRSFDPPDLDQVTMEKILQLVVYDVRCEYVAGYYAASPKRGTHKVKVSLVDKSIGKLQGGQKEFVY